MAGVLRGEATERCPGVGGGGEAMQKARHKNMNRTENKNTVILPVCSEARLVAEIVVVLNVAALCKVTAS